MRINQGLARHIVGVEEGAPTDEGPSKEGVLALMALGLLLVAGFLLLPPVTSIGITSEIAHILPTAKTSASTLAIYSPLISNGAANVSYPADYGALSTFALNLINQDRANQTEPPVTPGTNPAGQQHADSMLRYDYFSHFDTQGLKPYMRYTLLGGVGAVSENVAYVTWKGNHFTDLSAVEDSIRILEHAMMYNDSICCNNGHRLDIINPLHNHVAIGLAYNSSTLFLVEDFENYYIDLSYNLSKAYVFSMSGRVVAPMTGPTQIFVTFDSKPTQETPEQLDAGPTEYGAGDLLGGVLPPCNESCKVLATGLTVQAMVWEATSQSVDISFDLSRFTQVYGAGVYTVYLLTGEDTGSALTSISVFIS